MDLVNYDSSYFSIPNSSEENKKKLDYLHFVIVTHLISIYDNTKKSEDIKPIIKNINLSIKKGELIGIKGAVGSGKSSLFSCILGEMKPIDYKLDSTEAKPLHFDYYSHIE